LPYYTPTDPTAEDTLLSRLAAGYVQKLAPVPDPEPADYADLAEAAEYAVYNYLKRTGAGVVASQSARGLSASYASIKTLASIIGPVMGEYYEGAPGGFRVVEIDRA
jgi:hypothetical protein